MTTRRLVREVLSLNPEHKTSGIIIDLVYEALHKHLPTFKSLTRSIGNNVKTAYCTIVREMFSDGVRNWGRVAIVFAFAIFLQHKYKIDLEEETVLLTEDMLASWMEAQGNLDEDFGYRRHPYFIPCLIGTVCLFLLLLDTYRSS